MKPKKRHLILLFMMLSMMMLAVIPAQAASQKSLTANKTYSKYDVTNDGKADTISVNVGGDNYGYYTTISVKLNDKTAYSIGNLCIFDASAKLLKLDNNKTYLWLRGAGDNGDGANQILEYNKSAGKFKCIADFESIFGKYGSHITSSVKSVKGKKIKFSVYMVSYSLGTIQFYTTFTYKSGTLKQSNSMTACKVLNAGKKHNTLTANRKLTAYGSRSLSGKKYTISKNQKITISKFYLNGSRFLYKINVDGKTRWMTFRKKFPSKPFFKDVYYAG